MASKPKTEKVGSRIRDAEDILRFTFAGNAKFTLVSKKTGVRFTFRVRQKADEDGVPQNFWFVQLLSGPNNDEDFQYIGFIFGNVEGCEGVLRHGGSKTRVGRDSPSWTAFQWFFENLMDGQEEKLERLEFWHEGTCGRCGRTLTVPASIASGFGPECINYV